MNEPAEVPDVDVEVVDGAVDGQQVQGPQGADLVDAAGEAAAAEDQGGLVAAPPAAALGRRGPADPACRQRLGPAREGRRLAVGSSLTTFPMPGHSTCACNFRWAARLTARCSALRLIPAVGSAPAAPAAGRPGGAAERPRPPAAGGRALTTAPTSTTSPPTRSCSPSGPPTMRPPASVEKLYTATAALERLGPEYRLSHDRLRHRPHGPGGRLGRQASTCAAGGDPTFGSSALHRPPLRRRRELRVGARRAAARARRDPPRHAAR